MKFKPNFEKQKVYYEIKLVSKGEAERYENNLYKWIEHIKQTVADLKKR